MLHSKKSFKKDTIKLSLFRVIRPPINSGYWLFGKTRCLSEDTLVHTENGLTKIKDCKKVLTYNFDNNLLELKKCKVHRTMIKNPYEIIFEDNSKIFCSYNHVWFVNTIKGSRSFQTKDLSIGDYLICHEQKLLEVWKEIIQDTKKILLKQMQIIPPNNGKEFNVYRDDNNKKRGRKSLFKRKKESYRNSKDLQCIKECDYQKIEKLWDSIKNSLRDCKVIYKQERIQGKNVREVQGREKSLLYSWEKSWSKKESESLFINSKKKIIMELSKLWGEQYKDGLSYSPYRWEQQKQFNKQFDNFMPVLSCKITSSKRIKSIRIIKTIKKMFDLEVEDNHNFFIENGILTHNSGKTVLMLRLSSSLHDKYGFKVWDIWGGKRNQGENLYWCLPSPYKNYWSHIRKKYRFDKEGAKQYKVNLCYPLTKNLPKEIPYLKNEKDEVIINPKIFTIPIKKITVQQIRFVLNNVSDSDITLWENIRSKLSPKDGLPELKRIFEKKGKNTAIYKNFFSPLIDMRMLSSEDKMGDGEYVLDIVKEAKDRESIFVLVLHHIPDKFRLLILGYIIQEMWDEMNMSKISGKNIVNIREATEFFRATEKSTIENRFKEFKIFLTEFIRQARGRMAFILDAQSTVETRGLVSGSEDFSIYGKMPSEEDRKMATDQLKRDGKITPNQISELGELEPGEYFFVESGKDAKKRYSFLPPCDFFRDHDQNFYKIWAKRKGNDKFIETSMIIRSVDDKFKIRYSEIMNKEREIELKKTEKDLFRQKIEEEKKIEDAKRREKMMYEAKMKAREEAREKMKDEKIKEKLEKEKNQNQEKEIRNKVETLVATSPASSDGANQDVSSEEDKEKEENKNDDLYDMMEEYNG